MQVFAVGCRCAKLPNQGWVNSDAVRACYSIYSMSFQLDFVLGNSIANVLHLSSNKGLGTRVGEQQPWVNSRAAKEKTIAG